MYDLNMHVPRPKMEVPIYVVMLLLTICNPGLCQQSFSNSPRDTGVLVGETAILECAINNKIGNVYWEKNGNIIAGENANTGRVRVIVFTTLKQYNLRITGTTASDSGEYTCLVTENGFSDGYRRAQPASLSVVEPSIDNTYPQCVQSIMSGVKEGDVITLTCVCRINSISDDLDLEWIRGGDMVASQGTIYQLNDDHLVRRYTFVVDGYDHDVIYACIAKSSSFPTPVSCTTGPLNVQFTPKISMEPKVAYAYLGDDILIRCNALANPDVEEHYWLYDGRNISLITDTRVSVDDDGQTLVIRNLNSNDHEMDITCVVLNSMGTSVQHSSIEIVNLPVSNSRIGWLIAAIVLAVLILILLTYTFWECSKQRKDIIKNKNIKMWVEGGTPPYHPSENGSSLSRRMRPEHDPQDTVVDSDEIPLSIRESTRYNECHEQTQFIEEIQETHIGESKLSERTDSGLTESPTTSVEMHTVPSEPDHKTEPFNAKHRHRSPDGSENPDDADELPKKDDLVYADLEFDNYGKRRTIMFESKDSGVGVDSADDIKRNLDDHEKVKPISPIRATSEQTVYAQIRKSNRPRPVKIINKDSTTECLY